MKYDTQHLEYALKRWLQCPSRSNRVALDAELDLYTERDWVPLSEEVARPLKAKVRIEIK